jgi:GntR family transcriptional regulator, vanillate catabolism transcriptional regulator
MYPLAMSRNAAPTVDSHQARVLVQLRDLILKGEFAPEQRLAEVTLATRLGVSRTPVRLALATLEREGLVSRSGSVGYVMRRFTPKEIQDAIDVRGQLEGMAARLIAEQGAPPTLLLSLRECVREGDALFALDGHDLDYAGYTEMNDRFHELIVQGCGNGALGRAIEINNRLPFAPASAMLPMQSTLDEGHRWMLFAQMQHRSLLQAIEAGQGARAQSIAQEHVQIAKLNLKLTLERQESAERLMPALKLVATDSANEFNQTEPS